MELIEKVENLINSKMLISEGDHIIVGVSGGPDSICLLHVLLQIQKQKNNFKITVAHINHLIRQNAILDEKYVDSFCNKNNIPIFIKRADVEEIARKRKIGTEEAGRAVRYEFFEEVRKKVKANKIATAHNANDNAETMILNIIRGCGIDGLNGIEANNGIIIRPLINIRRDEIEKYCKLNKLNPREDESNLETIYQRNKVRNIMIPYVKKEFNNNIVETLNRLSKLAQEETNYIEEITIKQYLNIVKSEENGKIELCLNAFNNLETVIKKRLIRYTIEKTIGNIQGIGNIHVEDIIKMCDKKIGNKFLTPNKKIKVCIKNKKIIFEAI